MSECQIARYLNVYKMKNNKNMFAPDESLKVSGPKISILFPAQQTGAGGLKVSTQPGVDNIASVLLSAATIINITSVCNTHRLHRLHREVTINILTFLIFSAL